MLELFLYYKQETDETYSVIDGFIKSENKETVFAHKSYTIESGKYINTLTFEIDDDIYTIICKRYAPQEDPWVDDLYKNTKVVDKEDYDIIWIETTDINHPAYFDEEEYAYEVSEEEYDSY